MTTTPPGYINLVGLYAHSLTGPSVLPHIAARLRPGKGGRVFAWSRVTDRSGAVHENSAEATCADLMSDRVWDVVRGVTNGFIGVSKGRELLRLHKPGLLWASIDGAGQEFTQTRTHSTPCNMLHFFVHWPFSGLRKETDIRAFIIESMIDMASAGELIGAFCTIADEADERGGQLYNSVSATPNSQPVTVLREQMILALSQGEFGPPQHAVALSVPLAAVSAQARTTLKPKEPFVYTIREHIQDTPQFSAMLQDGHVHCMIQSEIKYLLKRPLNSGCIDHAKESLLMRRWLLQS